MFLTESIAGFRVHFSFFLKIFEPKNFYENWPKIKQNINQLKTRMHSSRMRTARTVTIRWGGGVCSRGVGVSAPGGCLLWGGGVSAPGGGGPCDISHHAFDVICMLPAHQLRHINSAPAFILLPGHVTCKACWDAHPPPVDRHTPVKT